MWVQVPPLASSCRRTRRLVAALLWLSLAACSRFEEPLTIGPADGVVSRATGPAAALATGTDRTIAAFAVESPAGTGMSAVDLGEASRLALESVELSRSSKWRHHPPLAFGGDGVPMTIVWRESARNQDSRVAWAEASGDGFSLGPPLVGPFGSEPRGSGSPPSLIAVEGAPDRPTTGSRLRGLRTWQRTPGSPGGWKPLGGLLQGRPLGYDVVGAGNGRATAAVLDDRQRLVLAGHPTAHRPAGPGWVWLSSADDALLAAWSEWTPGGAVAVRLTRSTDDGAHWSPPLALEERPAGPHPLASFARDGNTVGATWIGRTGEALHVVVAVSIDAGATFGPVASLSGNPGGKPSRPRLAIQGDRLLVTWQESAPPGGRIVAALSASQGDSWQFTDETVATGDSLRVVRNPLPWLDAARGGVLWESTRRLDPAQPPSSAAAPPGISLHARRLSR